MIISDPEAVKHLDFMAFSYDDSMSMKDVRSDSTNLKSSCYTSGTVGDVSQFDFPSGLRILWSRIYKHNQQWWHFESHAKPLQKNETIISAGYLSIFDDLWAIYIYFWLFLHMSYNPFLDTVAGAFLSGSDFCWCRSWATKRQATQGEKGPCQRLGRKGKRANP